MTFPQLFSCRFRFPVTPLFRVVFVFFLWLLLYTLITPAFPRPAPPPQTKQRIPTSTTTTASQRFKSAEPIMAARRAGMTAAGRNFDSNNQDPFAPRNTWPRNGSTPVRRQQGGSGSSNGNSNSKSNAPARSPLSIYGDGAFHSFTVCGAPGCKVCSSEGAAQRAAFYVSDRSRGGGGEEGGGEAGGGRPAGRSLVQRACEHCRCPFVPKPSGGEDEEVQGSSSDSKKADDVVGSDECDGDSSSAASSIVEGTLAGGGMSSAGSSFSSANDGEEGHLPVSPLVGVMGARPAGSFARRPQQQQQQARQMLGGNGDDCLDAEQEEGFCSGDCKISYMLTNSAAVRRRRAVAAANAAARAAAIEERFERSRRAARGAGGGGAGGGGAGVTGKIDQSAAAAATAVRRRVQREEAADYRVASPARVRD